MLDMIGRNEALSESCYQDEQLRYASHEDPHYSVTLDKYQSTMLRGRDGWDGHDNQLKVNEMVTGDIITLTSTPND
jgi:hypothetical protein